MTKIISNKKLEKGILKGAKKLNQAVSSTLGPYGKTTLITKDGKLKATKDGVSVAKSIIKLEVPEEDAGAQLIKNVAEKSANEVGDGTTTSTLLAYSMLKQGFHEITNGSNPVLVKKGIEEAINEVVEFLESQSVKLTENSQIQEIATISGNNDEEIGKLIAKAFDKVGRDGIISLEKSKTGKPSLEIVEGMQFDRGYKSPYFVTDNDTMLATLHNPEILIYDGKITQASEILDVLQHISTIEGKSILIVADDIEGEALATLIMNKMRGIVNSIAVAAPEFGERRRDYLHDLAVITGGKVFSKETGYELNEISNDQLKEYLGTARKVNVSKDKTTIIDGKCSDEDLEKRIEILKGLYEEAGSNFEKEKLQQRIGNLSGGVAIIEVGGNSELEIEEKKDRMEDALHATKAAIEGGILPGGGVSLLYAKQHITKSNNKDVQLGKGIIKFVLSTPFLRILHNAGVEESKSLLLSEKLIDTNELWNGYDISTDSIINMKDHGIIDPFKVIKMALINSSSIVGTLLTTSAYVYEEEKEGDSNPMSMGGGMF
jgi:chaperonin GroEL